MQKFEYRQPRVPANLPIKFSALNVSCVGHCVDISKQGMRIETSQPLPLNTRGKVSMCYQDRTLEFAMRVVHVEGMSCGLEFLYDSSEERNEVAHLVASLAASPQRASLVLVHGI